MKYDALALSWAGDKYLGRPYSEMECQAFVERCMSDVGYHRDLPGSNAWYRAMDWTGSPEDCLKEFGQIPKGALLFILKQDGKEPAKYQGDGIGNASHIGMKTGRNDGAIHSSSSKGCVCTSKFQDKTIANGGWNRVGLLKVFDYGNSVNWILDHEGGQEPPGEDVKPMQGKVTAPSGSTVNLRKSPDGALIERIPIGTDVTVIDYGEDWCKVIAGNLTGWMMTQFIEFDGEVVPAPDPDDDDDFTPGDGDDDYGPGDLVNLQIDYKVCADAYPFLRELCSQIEKKVGRG